MSTLISQRAINGDCRQIDVSAHESGTIGISVGSYGGDYMRFSFHVERDQAIRLRDLIDAALGDTTRASDLSNLRPVMAEALAPFLGDAA